MKIDPVAAQVAKLNREKRLLEIKKEQEFAALFRGSKMKLSDFFDQFNDALNTDKKTPKKSPKKKKDTSVIKKLKEVQHRAEDVEKYVKFIKEEVSAAIIKVESSQENIINKEDAVKITTLWKRLKDVIEILDPGE